MRVHLHLVGCHQTGEHSKKDRSTSHVDHVLHNFGLDHARAGSWENCQADVEDIEDQE